MPFSSRRQFLRSSAFFAAGAAASWAVPLTIDALLAGSAEAAGPEARLRELKITLPPPSKPPRTLVPAVRVDNLLYVSGTGPRREDGTFIQGKVGQLTVEDARAAARLVGLNVLSAVRGALGSLDRVVRLVKVLGMVNSPPEFTEHPKVIDGFSELMIEVFGESAGKGARSAVGMGSLPFNIVVEIEAIFQVRD